jgi:hypothetical protein
MMWDHEVDVVCVGGRIGGLASAIVAVGFGAEVFVATASPHPHRGDIPRGWLSDDSWDAETNEYFAALSEDLVPVPRSAAGAAVPTRVVHELSPADRNVRTVEPFLGARLRDWAAQCLASPYGLLHTRVSDWRTTTMRTADGEIIEVGVVGAMEPHHGVLTDWLTAQAHARHIEVQSASPLKRIVFEDGDVVGAVVDTPDGPCAVRARHGVTVAPETQQVDTAPGLALPAGRSVQVCLVSQHASRFSRVELLTTRPVPPAPRSTCRAINRHLHDSLRETRQPRSPARRCRKVHRDPPFGE